METHNWPKVTPRHCDLELRLLGYLTRPATLLFDGAMAPALGYTQHLETRALCSLGCVSQGFPDWLWELVGRAVHAPPPASVLPLHGSQQCSLLPSLIALPPPACRAQEPFQEPEPGTLLGGSSLPPWFCRSPSLHHVWPLHALNRPPPPMPGTLSWPDPCGAGRSRRAGRAAARIQGGRQSRLGWGLLLDQGYLLPHSFCSPHS